MTRHQQGCKGFSPIVYIFPPDSSLGTLSGYGVLWRFKGLKIGWILGELYSSRNRPALFLNVQAKARIIRTFGVGGTVAFMVIGKNARWM